VSSLILRILTDWHWHSLSFDQILHAATVRDEAKLSKGSLLQVNVPAGTQPCTKFGIHPKLTLYKSLYDDGDASFFANIGTLVEPLTKEEFQGKTKPVPPSLFAHNTQQRQSQSLHAQLSKAKGVLGRIRDALTSQQPAPVAANAYSITGTIYMGSCSVLPKISR
jgi:uncharacterized protein (DUF1501 family)